MTTPVAKFSDPMLGAAKTIAPGAGGVFDVFSQQGTLPSHLSLEGLVSWLSTKMNETDADIRGRMSEVNDQKDAEKKLHDLISKLQGCVKKDSPDGMVDVPADLADAKLVRDSKLYASLGPDGKKALEQMLSKVSQDFVVNADFAYWGGVTVPKGTVVNSGKLADYKLMGMTDSNFDAMGPRMSNDDLDTTIKSLTEASSAISSNDEVNMIGLQTKIAARAQLVQLISNMISSVTDTNRMIISNCKGG